MKKQADYRHPCPLCGMSPIAFARDLASKGGKAAAISMTKAQKTARAKKAAKARWSKTRSVR